MTGKRKRSGTRMAGNDGQSELFGPVPGSCDVSDSLRAAMKATIRKCPLSRYEIAARMSELLERDVTKTMIDSWLSETKEYHRIPAEYLPAFCRVVKSPESLRALALVLGMDLADGDDLVGLKLVRLQRKRKRIENEEQELRRKAGI